VVFSIEDVVSITLIAASFAEALRAGQDDFIPKTLQIQSIQNGASIHPQTTIHDIATASQPSYQPVHNMI